MALAMHRYSSPEQQRIHNISKLLPRDAHSVLDAGATDGHLSLLLAKTFDSVTALDLNKPEVQHSRIHPVDSDVTRLSYADRAFDMVLCNDVLEHLPTPLLRMACRELKRVARRYVLVGVPYKQDLRIGRTTCYSCKAKNPPWSHLHTFSEQRLCAMFPGMEVESVSYVGSHRERTNKFSTRLLDWAGNPHGTYEQDEPCIHCGKKLISPTPRNIAQKALTKAAMALNNAQSLLARPKPNLIHMLLKKPERYAYPIVSAARDSFPAANVRRRLPA